LQGDLIAYLASLERVLALKPARLMPAHGPVMDDPESVLRGYIEHRREREQQIVDVLREGASDPDAIVARLYRGLKDTLVPMARESVLAHLLKLEREGRASRTRGAGRAAASAPGASASAPRATADRSAPKEEAWHIIEP
jgi:glyoxylase-like metal-dependent hydrolase (beta-lactamase superfamily II)